ncbi:MAG: hypothetical protein PHD71_08760 [Methanospirillum sp.]|nr:hypothetical protein [Methanospirillum sp.]
MKKRIPSPQLHLLRDVKRGTFDKKTGVVMRTIVAETKKTELMPI